MQIEHASPYKIYFTFICPPITILPTYDYDSNAGSATFYQADIFGPYS